MNAMRRAYRGASGRALFLDRDGVINERIPSGHVVSWEQFRLRSGVLEALAPIAERNLPIVVISNQSCIARATASASAVVSIMEEMADCLASRGVALTAWYCCPHGPDDSCSCRKPQPGMIIEASRDLGIDVSQSYLIGDKQSDLDAGLEAGCRISIQIDEDEPTSLGQAVRGVCEDVDASGR